MLQAKHAARLQSILGIAQKDGRMQELIAGKNYKVVGIAVERIGPPRGRAMHDTFRLILKTLRLPRDRPISDALFWCSKSITSFTRLSWMYHIRG